jgi:hypothetical protein
MTKSNEDKQLLKQLEENMNKIKNKDSTLQLKLDPQQHI